ncbi:hypothetical protein Aduo_018510 [Ancylostoma duodenale]
MFASLATRNITPSMVAISEDDLSRDLPKGKSLSFRLPEAEDDAYRSTHISRYWKISAYTPGRNNDCSAQEHLRKFDETTGYTSTTTTVYQFPEEVEQQDVGGEVPQEDVGGDDEDVEAGREAAAGAGPVAEAAPATGAGPVAVVAVNEDAEQHQ